MVLFSTSESRKQGQLSVLAIIESLAALLVVVLVVRYTGLTTIAFLGASLSFLVLLRSPQSIEDGLCRFEKYRNKPPPTLKTFWVTWSLGIALSNLPFVIMFGFEPAEDYVAVFFWVSALAAIPCVSLTIAVLGFGSDGFDDFTLSFSGLIFLWFQEFFRNLGAWFKRNWLFFFVVLAASSMIPSTEYVQWVLLVPLSFFMFGLLFFAPAFPLILFSSFWGILLRVICIRFVATLTNIHKGIPRFAENWRSAAFVDDSAEPLVILPGLKADDALSLRSRVQALKHPPDGRSSIYQMVPMLTFYVPTLLYRLYLKGAIWLYLPLAALTFVPAAERGTEGLKWNSGNARGSVAVLTFVMSLTFLGVFVVGAMDFDELARLQLDMLAMFKTTNWYLAFWAIQWSEFIGWKGLFAASTLLTVILFVWSDRINNRIEHNSGSEPGQFELRIIRTLSNLKGLMNIAWVLFALTTFAIVSAKHGHFGVVLGKLVLGGAQWFGLEV